jgi:hypothetical protein
VYLYFTQFLKSFGARDSSVGIATGWTTGVRFPAGARDFNLLCNVQTGSGAHPASYPGALSPGVERPGRQADHSPPSSAEVENGGAVPLLSLRLHGAVLN